MYLVPHSLDMQLDLHHFLVDGELLSVDVCHVVEILLGKNQSLRLRLIVLMVMLIIHVVLWSVIIALLALQPFHG